MLVLKIALGVIVGLVVGVALLLLLARTLLKRLAKNLAQAVGAIGSVPPARITLDGGVELDWSDDRWLERQTGLLTDRGFAVAGEYDIDEMPGVRVRGFVNEHDGVLAALTEHDQAGCWVDIVQVGEDDSCITVTGSPPTGLACPSWKTTVREQGADASRLLELLMEQRDQAASPRRFATSEFRAVFEQAYAREMDWMLDRGGPTEEEIREIARLGGQDSGPEAIASLRCLWNQHAASHRERQLRERFLATTDMPAAEWERVQDRLVFVYDRMNEEELDELVGDVLDWEDEESCESVCERAREARGQVEGVARQAFTVMNATLPDELRYTKRAQLAGPIPADVYEMPVTAVGGDDELRRAS